MSKLIMNTRSSQEKRLLSISMRWLHLCFSSIKLYIHRYTHVPFIHMKYTYKNIYYPIKNYWGLRITWVNGLGVCSSYKRGGQPLYNLPVAHLRFTGIFPSSYYKQQYHPSAYRRIIQGNFPLPNYKHPYELWPTCGKTLYLRRT